MSPIIFGVKRSKVKVTPALKIKWFPDNNSRTLHHRIMKPSKDTLNDKGMTPFNFRVTPFDFGSKVKVTQDLNLKFSFRMITQEH